MELNPVTNGGQGTIALSEPYNVTVTIEGVAPLLLHAWNSEAVAEKAKAAKGSRAKKEDDLESYVYRDSEGNIILPGEYLRQSIIRAAKFIQDPRSPRKSAMDLFKAGLICLSEGSPLAKEWDYVDQRRAVIHGNGVTRCRPAFKAGWRAVFDLGVLLPEYITRELLGTTLTAAGRFVGVGDFRPTYGRFMVVGFK